MTMANVEKEDLKLVVAQTGKEGITIHVSMIA